MEQSSRAELSVPKKPIEEFDLKALAHGMPGITPALGRVLAEAAAVCLENRGHIPGVLLVSCPL